VKVLLPRDVDPVIRNGKIERTLPRLDLVQATCINTVLKCIRASFGKMTFASRRSPGRRISEFAA
jgi:hypothetical protein